jgi:parallel beta-helix repeat protein
MLLFAVNIEPVNSELATRTVGDPTGFSDALIAPDLRRVSSEDPMIESSAPGYYETSEYLIGRVAVSVVFLESNGTIDSSTEDWTSQRETQVVSKIENGLSWLANQNPNANVSFVYDIHYRIPTNYEPINRPHTDSHLWISQAMTDLGYAGTNPFTQVRDCLNGLRTRLGTDWSFAIFVVDSLNDPDGCFTDSIDATRKYSAFAYLGGPLLVMTYDNDGYGITNMHYVTAHETCHVFYATDEYNGYTETCGYLGVKDLEGSGCMMDRGNTWWLCTNSKQQLGWRDNDGDGIQDITDTFPDTQLTPYSPDPTNKTFLKYTGYAKEMAYPNQNPYGTGNNITINKIRSVEFRAGHYPWSKALPADGAFDHFEESFVFTTLPLAAGNYSVETRGINSVWNIEISYAIDEVTTVSSYGTPIYSVSSPLSSALGLTWDGEALWVNDGFDAVIYRFDPYTNTTLKSLIAPTSHPRGLAWDGESIWLASWDSPRAIYKIDPANGSVLTSFPPPFSGHPDGLAWDGLYLWIGEEDGRIYKVDPSNGSAVFSFSVPYEPSGNPRGLTWDGTSMWVGYQSVGLIKRHDADGNVLACFESPSGSYQQGLAWDGQHLWSTGGDNVIYKLPVAFIILRVPEDFLTIQSAINAAYDGDTVFVSSGTYHENVVVNKTISLLGENRDTTIIDDDSTWYVVEFQNVSDAQISNFTIQNGEVGIGLYQTINVTISENLIQNASGTGILIMDSAYALMRGNEIVNNGRGLGSIGYITDCVFAQNNITGNSWGGLSGEDGFWLENSIIGNNITYNQYFGICLYDYHAMARSNSIIGNNISNNEGGILLYCSCQNNTISGNNISANTGWAVSLSSGPSNNSISGNTITDNGNGILMNTGLAICSNNSVFGNNIEANGGYGILLEDATNNSLSGNNITNNLYGVGLGSPEWYATGSEGNLILENNIVTNSICGIEVFNSSYNLICHNNLLGLQLVSSQNSTNVWDEGYPSGGNYWSDYTGVDADHDGIGDSPYVIDVSNVDNYPLMTPWGSTSPASAYLVVRGNDNQIYYRLYNSTINFWDPWSVLPGLTVDRPAAAVCSGKLYLIVRGAENSGLWFGSVNLTNRVFLGWSPLAGVTESAPTMVSNGTHLIVVVRGTDNAIYYRSYACNTESWSTWIGLPGETCDQPAATVLGTELHLVVRGYSASSVTINQTLWHGTISLANGSFSGWIRVAGETDAAPSLAASSSRNTAYLSVKGTNGVLYLNKWTGTWQGWTAMTGATNDSPALAVTGDLLQVVVRELGADRIWHCNVDLNTDIQSVYECITGLTPTAPTINS